MVDFHSHILPGIDDGSRNTEQSAEMLRALAAQKVDTVALTPHFYGQESTPEKFLARRTSALERLTAVLEPGMPALRPGAEVYFFRGISHMEQLPALRLQGTRLLLLEMPFAPWGAGAVQEVLHLCEDPEYAVMLAHVDRYFSFAPAGAWDALCDAGVLMQANAEALLSWKSRGRVLRMLQRGQIHVLGTDCHNMTSRRPQMSEAAAVLQARLGERWAGEFFERADAVLEEYSL